MTSGIVAALAGDVAQVQGGGIQTAVQLGSASVTRTTKGSLGDVAVGDCVMIMLVDSETGNTLAISVSTTLADDDGVCAVGGGMFPGGDRQMPELAGGRPLPEGIELPEVVQLPHGAERPEGGSTLAGRNMLAGQVINIDDVQITIEMADQTQQSVIISEQTTYSITTAVTAQDVAIGLCIMAVGEQDSAGAISAATVQLTDPVDGACEARGMAGRPAGATPGSGPARQGVRPGGN
jgi:hypothetical protein